MHVAIGTAGHIDHGKSTLVTALTGQRMDRLPEEQRRGITLALGFARLPLAPDLEASVVDVPGHERLVHTMVSGAWGLDALMLVVAADEGVMPQTREHLAIAQLLGMRGLVVALTKVDRVDAALLSLATEDVQETLSHHGFHDVPIIPVAALTGAGIPELRAALVKTLRALPARPADGTAFLPVDRVFTVKGFGTVVTGTLSGGSLAVDQEVDLHPGARALRIRSLQTHGENARAVGPGWRVAVNLPGVAVEDVVRGCVLAPAGALEPARRLEVRLRTLPAAPRVRDHAAVTVHVGTASVPARVRCVFAGPDETPAVEGGEEKLVQLVLAEPVACRPGQRFILRGHKRLPGQGSTWGGGEILDPAAPMRRRGRAETLRAAEALGSGDPAARLVQAVFDAGAVGASSAELERRLPYKDLRKLVEAAVGRGHLRRIRPQDHERLCHPERLATLSTRVRAALEHHHREHPSDAAVTLDVLRGAVRVDGVVVERPLFAALVAACRDPAVVLDDSGARMAAHRPRGVSPELLAAVETAHAGAGVSPPTRAELVASTGAALTQVTEALRTLVTAGKLVRVKDDLHFARAPYDDLVARTLAFMDGHGGITTQEFKALMGESRKYVIPFLEHLDETRVTLRVGEKRVRRSR